MLRTTLGMSAEAQRRGAVRATMLSAPGTRGGHGGTFMLCCPNEASRGTGEGCPAAGDGKSRWGAGMWMPYQYPPLPSLKITLFPFRPWQRVASPGPRRGPATEASAGHGD